MVSVRIVTSSAIFVIRSPIRAARSSAVNAWYPGTEKTGLPPSKTGAVLTGVSLIRGTLCRRWSSFSPKGYRQDHRGSQNGKYFHCTFHVSSRTHPPALIVTIGAPSLPPVSVRVIANIRNEKSFFDW